MCLMSLEQCHHLYACGTLQNTAPGSTCLILNSEGCKKRRIDTSCVLLGMLQISVVEECALAEHETLLPHIQLTWRVHQQIGPWEFA